MRTRKISCFVICCNEEDRIGACLESLAGWADQLIVVDSGSKDKTVEIARQYTDEVHQTDWPGFGPQRNRALAWCEHDWVMTVDADEVLTPELKDEIDQVLSEPDLDANFIKMPWHTYFFGRLLKHGRYSAPQGKLFHKEGAHFKHRQVHETIVLPYVKTRNLKSPILHYSWRSFRHCQEKHVQYASLGAEDKFQRGKKSGLAYAVLRFFTDFIQQFFLRGGFLDGWRGFLMAIVLGQYAFNKYATLATLVAEKKAANNK